MLSFKSTPKTSDLENRILESFTQLEKLQSQIDATAQQRQSADAALSELQQSLETQKKSIEALQLQKSQIEAEAALDERTKKLRAIAIEVNELSDELFDKLQDFFLEWEKDHSVSSNGSRPTLLDYRLPWIRHVVGLPFFAPMKRADRSNFKDQ